MPPFRFDMPESARDFHSYLRWRPGKERVHFLESLVSLPVAQSARHRSARDAIVVGGLRKGSLSIEQSRHRDHSAPTPHNFLFLVLPRKTVEAALGCRADLGGQTVQKLSQTGLAPFLWKQLQMLAEHGPELSADEREFVLSLSQDMALAALRGRFGIGAANDDDSVPDQLLAAARRCIDRNYQLPDLSADRIASALYSSRTQLFRCLRGAV
jgi:hypothetical protein